MPLKFSADTCRAVASARKMWKSFVTMPMFSAPSGSSFRLFSMFVSVLVDLSSRSTLSGSMP